MFQCLYFLIILSQGYSGFYDVGERVSTDHQNIAYPVCYGDYPSDNLTLQDFNGFENGGNHKIIWVEMLTTW